MSYTVTAMVRAARLPRSIKARAGLKSVLFSLADRTTKYGENARPSVATIAAEASIGVRTAEKRLADAVKFGFASEQCPPTQHQPRTYRLDLAAIAALFDDPITFEKRYPRLAKDLAADPQLVAYLPTTPGSQDRASRPAECDPQGRKRGRPDPQPVADDPNNRPLNGTGTARVRAQGPLPVEKVKEEEEGGTGCGAYRSLDDDETDRGALTYRRVIELATKLLPDGPKPEIDSEVSVVEAIKRELIAEGSRTLSPWEERRIRDACSDWLEMWHQRRTDGVRAAAAEGRWTACSR